MISVTSPKALKNWFGLRNEQYHSQLLFVGLWPLKSRITSLLVDVGKEMWEMVEPAHVLIDGVIFEVACTGVSCCSDKEVLSQPNYPNGHCTEPSCLPVLAHQESSQDREARGQPAVQWWWIVRKARSNNIQSIFSHLYPFEVRIKGKQKHVCAMR